MLRRSHDHRRRGRQTLLLFGTVLGALLALPARAANYYEMNGPVRLGAGGATWVSKQNPITPGRIDVATGAYLLEEAIVTLRARQPFHLAWFYTSQDATAGPIGPGTSLSCDWFVARSQAIAGQPYELIAPGCRHYAFNATPNGAGDYFNDRDPELLGATLHLTGTGLTSTLRWKDGRKYSFDANGALIRLEDRHANAVTIERNGPQGFASKVSITADRYLQLDYDATTTRLLTASAHYRTGSIFWKVINWQFAYNATTGWLDTMTAPVGATGVTHVTQFVWGSYSRTWNGQTLTLPLLLRLFLPKGNQGVDQDWDTSGRIISHRAGQQGYTWTASYSTALGSNGTTTVTDPRGNVTRWNYSWNPSKYGYLVTSTTDALSRTTSYARTATPSYLVTSITDSRGRQTSFGWDRTRGNLTSVTIPTTSGGTVTWNAAYETTFSQQTSVTDPLGRQTVYTVNAATGDTTAFRDARSNTTSFTFAPNGDRLTTTNALNKTTQYTYEPVYGDLSTVTDPLNHVTTYRVTKRSLPWDVTDANGKIVIDDTFDDLEQLIEEDRTLNGNTLRTQYFYDGNGHLGSVENPNNISWSKVYNTLDQLDYEADPASRFTRYEYDLNGNVSKRTDRKGQYLLYTYGPADRLEGINCYKIGSILESTVTLNYDPTTKLLSSVTDNEFGAQTWSWTYDSLDRITGVSGPNGSVTYTLDTLGRRTGMTATGQSPITYGFSPIDQIASITQNSQSYTFTYDPLNRMSRRSLPNGVTADWAFDDAGSLTSLISKKSGVTFDSHLYTPDPVGHIVQENHNGTLDVFGYDDLYRLTSATVSGTSYRWSYDNNGNRLTQDKGLVHTDYTCDQCDCLLSVNGLPVTSDTNGSATGFGSDVYSWDVRNRMVKLTRPGLTVEFTYDPFGDRTSKKVNGTLTKFLLDGESVVSEVTGSTTVNTLQSPVIDQPLARNGRFFAPNELGSTTKLTDGAGVVVQSYDYSPFGETTQSTGEANPFQYAGRENDGTGVYYNRARYYVPEWGRFMSEDPLGFAGGLNRFTYANNNPITGSDPSGLFPDLMAPFRWAFQKLVGLFGVRLTPGTPTLQLVYIPDELMDDPDIAAERNRFSPAGHAVSEFIDQTGALLLAQILMGAVQRALPEPVQNLPKHHIFPQRGVLAQFFRSRGIDIDAYALQLPIQVHRQIHAGGAFGGAWNAAWEAWIDANPFATVEDIARQAGRMIYQFGLDGYPLVRYK